MERNTQQRQAILKVFEKSDRPLSVNEVLDLAKQHCGGIGIATVYRNLKALIDEGKVLGVEMRGGVVLYEQPRDEHHHHFSCVKCQRVFDVDACGLNLQKLIPPGFQLVDHEILLSGLCSICAAPT